MAQDEDEDKGEDEDGESGEEKVGESGEVDADPSRSRCALCGQKLVVGSCVCHICGTRVESAPAARDGRSRSPRAGSGRCADADGPATEGCLHVPPLMARWLRGYLPASISAFPFTSITVNFANSNN